MALSPKELLREVLLDKTREGIIFARAGQNLPANSLVYLSDMDKAHPVATLASALDLETVFPLFVCVEGATSGEITLLRPRSLLTGLDTSAATSGAVFLSDTAGQYSLSPGTETVLVGRVMVVDATDGQILLAPQMMPALSATETAAYSLVYAEGSTATGLPNVFDNWLDCYNAIQQLNGARVFVAIDDQFGTCALSGADLELRNVEFVAFNPDAGNTLVIPTGTNLASLPIIGSRITLDVTSNAVDQPIYIQDGGACFFTIRDGATVVNTGGDWAAFDSINGGIIHAQVRNKSSLGSASPPFYPVLGVSDGNGAVQVDLSDNSSLRTDALTDNGVAADFSIYSVDASNTISYTQDIAASIAGGNVAYRDRAAASQVAFVDRAVSANTVQSFTDAVIDCDASGGDFDVDLLSASQWFDNILCVKKGVGGIVTINASGLETIDGGASYTLTNDNQGVILYSNGTNIRVLSTANAGAPASSEAYVARLDPNAVASGYVFSDWASLYTVMNATTGEYVVELVYNGIDTPLIPAGNWDMSKVIFRTTDNQRGELFVEQGAVFTNGTQGVLPRGMQNVNLTFDNTLGPVCTLDGVVASWNLSECNVATVNLTGAVTLENGAELSIYAHNCELFGNTDKGSASTVDLTLGSRCTIYSTGTTYVDGGFVSTSDDNAGNIFQQIDNTNQYVWDPQAVVPAGTAQMYVARTTLWNTDVTFAIPGPTSYSMLLNDEFINVSINPLTPLPCTIDLLTPSEFRYRIVRIKLWEQRDPGSTLTIDAAAAPIDGVSPGSIVLNTEGECVTLFSDTTGWYILSWYIP